MKASARIISALMIATALLGFAAILPVYAQGAVMYVDPPNSHFTSDIMNVGDTFNVSVTVANISMFAGVAFIFTWDPTLLQCMGITEVLYHTITPPAFWSNIWSLQLKFNNTSGRVDYAQTWQDLTAAQSDGYAPANVTDPVVAANMMFKILVAPPMFGSVGCDFVLSEVKVGAIDATPIPTTATNGDYLLSYAPPTQVMYYSVSPATYTASNIGDVFNISIRVNNLVSGWGAVGFEFKLGYDDTILEILNVYEGPWLPPFGAPPNQGTLFMTLSGAGYIQVGDVVMPDVNGTWNPPFPNTKPGGIETPGTLAIIEFNATDQGLFPLVLSCPLDLYDTKAANYLGQPVNQTAPVDGFYSMKSKVLGRAVDVYVGQDGVPYPDPFGGQGPNAPADMFWPQKQVCVWVNVTYNEWPEQQKDVAIEIFDPLQARWGLIYARTNEFGTAYVCFRLPWPCDNPEDYIGVWTVTATVDIACQIVNDTVWFHYDYLVRIWKVTADKDSYKHNETACFTVEYGSHAQQEYTVILAITALDETGVPFGFAYKQVTIGGTVFCQYKNYTDTLCIYIPKWARAGVAEIDTAFLNDWPYLGGTVQSGFFTGSEWLGYCPINVNIEAAWA